MKKAYLILKVLAVLGLLAMFLYYFSDDTRDPDMEKWGNPLFALPNVSFFHRGCDTAIPEFVRGKGGYR